MFSSLFGSPYKDTLERENPFEMRERLLQEFIQSRQAEAEALAESSALEATTKLQECLEKDCQEAENFSFNVKHKDGVLSLVINDEVYSISTSHLPAFVTDGLEPRTKKTCVCSKYYLYHYSDKPTFYSGPLKLFNVEEWRFASLIDEYVISFTTKTVPLVLYNGTPDKLTFTGCDLNISVPRGRGADVKTSIDKLLDLLTTQEGYIYLLRTIAQR